MQKKLQDYSVLYKIKRKENYENNEKKQENKKKKINYDVMHFVNNRNKNE